MINFLLSNHRRRLLIWVTWIILILLSTEGRSQCSAPTLKFHSPVLLSGTDHEVGAVYLFADVAPGVDAHIEILGLYGGATLYNIDDSAGVGYYDAFQPYVGGSPNDTSYIDWKISFKVGGTNDDTMLACVAVTGVDVDGDGAHLQEFIEAATPGSIAVDPFTILHVSFDGVRSKAVSTVFNIPLIDTAHHEAMFQMNFENITTLLYRNGAISTWGAPQIRQTCIYFAPFFQWYALLPAKILSFSGKQSGKGNDIKWSAVNEDDTKAYVIEKSTDAKNWNDLMTVSHGSSANGNQYLYTDHGAVSGNAWYRLRQVNNQGKLIYSNVILVAGAADLKESVVHNTMVSSSVNFQIRSSRADEYTVEYYTMSGSRIKQDRFKVQAGMNIKTSVFDAAVSAGCYLVIVKNKIGELVHSSRLVKG